MAETLFDPRKVKRWRRDVWRALKADGYQPAQIPAGMVLAAVACVGTSPSVLVELTGSSVGYVTKILRRLRKERVLKGERLRIGWDRPGGVGSVAVLLDMGVAAGIFTRKAIDAVRSAAQQRRDASTYHRGPKRRHVKPIDGAVFTPQRVNSNPRYGLPEWDEARKA